MRTEMRVSRTISVGRDACDDDDDAAMGSGDDEEGLGFGDVVGRTMETSYAE